MRFVLGLGVAGCVFLGVGGCGNFGNALPESLDLTLPDETTDKAVRGGGAATLENSRWQLFNAETGRYIGAFVFVKDGALDSVIENNVIGAEVFGDTILADGAVHATDVDGLSYRAATYGVENESGFAYEARAIVTFAGVRVATGRATAVGTHDGDQMEGTFSYRIRVEESAASALPANLRTEDEFPVYGVRVAAE